MNSEEMSPQKNNTLLLTFVGILLICVIGAGTGWLIVKNTPEAVRHNSVKTIPKVKTLSIALESHKLQIDGTGELQAFQKIELKPEVIGNVIEINPKLELGATVEKGTLLYTLDSKDYDIAVIKQIAEVERYRLALKEEMGRQSLAEQEWKSLQMPHGSELEKELTLRVPHLSKAKAELEAAESALQQAKLNVERCKIVAPFKAAITGIYAFLGTRATPQDRLLQLLDCSRFDFHLQLRQDQLKWIPKNKNVEVFIEAQNQVTYSGKIKQILPELSSMGRMATVLVEVDLPDNALPSQFLISSFSSAHFFSDALEKSILVPRSCLHPENKVWIVNQQDELEFRQVEWEDAGLDQALVVKGLNTGDRLIVSNLSTPVQGMKLQEFSSESTVSENAK